jgi:RecA/RadA recombinase
MREALLLPENPAGGVLMGEAGPLAGEGFSDALSLLQSRQGEAKLSTGIPDLDSLLGGGIRAGAFYLFYGDEESGVDALLHQILICALLPPDRGGLGGKALYLNCGNYREERTILDIKQLTWLAKAAGLDPSAALDRVKVFLAFNLEQEEQVADRVSKALREDPKIGVLAVHNLARLADLKAPPSQELPERLQRVSRLQRIVSRLLQACSEAGVALVATCRPRAGAPGRVPEPEGGRYLRHACNYLVYMRRVEARGAWSIQAYLRKHPSKGPTRINISMGGVGLGRITIPFRTMFEEELNNLKRGFREALLDPARQEAFDHIVKGWTSEQGAMSYANVPTVLDVMLLVAAVDNRRAIDDLYGQVKLLREGLEEIRRSVRELAILVKGGEG